MPRLAALSKAFLLLVCVGSAVITISHATSGDVAVPLDTGGRRAMVEAQINGQGPFQFVVASTFTGVTIERALAVELGLLQDSQSEVPVWDLPAEDVFLDHIAFGGVVFEKVKAEAYGEEMQFLGKHPRGSLGLELFEDYLVTFDFPNGEFRLTQGSLDAEGTGVVSFTRQHVQNSTDPELVPAVSGFVSGVEMPISLHTGFIGSLQLHTDWMEKLPLTGPAGVIGNIATDKDQAELLGTSLAGDVRLIDWLVPNPPVFFSALYTNAALGCQGLEDFTLTIDQKGERLQLLRNDPARTEMFEAAAHIQDLAGEPVDLRAEFNSDADKIRMILILSPT